LLFIEQGETALHLACEKGLSRLVEVLLEKGANPNAQTYKPTLTNSLVMKGETTAVMLQTPLHLALVNKYSDIVEIFLQHKGTCIITHGKMN